ncbi:MAG TPA: asparagine synthase (glutamine-hydrolyzing), partial [Candidatus Polarisedimenticolia bacterium]|nr:asparagine synthase (glutamine-hydrolyzing) [Candidatus Polarisedimenticolia bacterium]
MCGIAGVFNFRDDRPADPALVESMTDVLAHRGPDDRGFYFSGPLGLGMRRLSIIDLQGGGQPIGNEDGSVQIVFNGAIYNHRALRRELEGRGHRFRTRSDTEAIVHGYEEYGPEVVQRLNGMFAFALWDASLRRLFLARDRLGIKPLYYAETVSGIVFASELKGILEAPDVDTDLDPVALQQYLAWEYIPAPATPFRSARKLLPATRLLVDRDGVRSQAYWQLAAAAPIADPGEAREGLRWHLQRSVRLRLEADVPVGAFLSGGLDSSILVATLASIREQPIHTFSIGFAEDDFNEVGYARAVARRFGTLHEEEILRPNCLDLIEEVAGFLDEPFADNSIIPTYLVSRLARRSVKVALSGDGADELFGGYDRYKADRIAALYSRLPAAVRGAMGRWLGDGPDLHPSKRGTLRTRLRKLGNALALPAHLEHARFMVRSTAALQPGFLQSAIDRHDADAWMAPWTDAFRQSPFEPGLARQQSVDVRTYLLDDILFKTDRASMAASLEARVPYLDHELVEYAFRI